MISETLKQIRRTPYQAIAAIMVMLLTFFALSTFCLISLGSIKVLKYFESAPQVIAFFEKGKDVPQEEITRIKSELERTGKLASFKYVSIREAEAIYKEKNKDDPLLLELVNYKILPPSIEISATEISALPDLKNVLEKQPGVEDIAFYEDIVNSLSLWIKNIRFFGLALIGYLLLQSLLVIIKLIGMKIMAKKSEIEIMRLLGASNWFISWPFILEGIIYGIISAFFAWGLSYISLLYATPFLISWLGEINILPVSYLLMLALLAVELFGGIVVGFFGSLISVNRFLKR